MERFGWGLYEEPFNGDDEKIGDLHSLQLRGLSTIPSSTFSFEKSIVAEAALVAKNKVYCSEN